MAKIILTFLAFFMVTVAKGDPVPILLFDDKEELAISAKKAFIEELGKAESENKKLVVIFPTGSTPLPFYREMVKAWETGEVNLRDVISFNMDEYVGLSEKDPQSYHFFMAKNFHGLVSSELTPFKMMHWLMDETSYEKTSFPSDSIQSFCKWIKTEKIDTEKNLNRIYSKIKNNLPEELGFQIFQTDAEILEFAKKLRRDNYLRRHGMDPKNIYIPDGASKDINEEIEEYGELLLQYANKKKYRIFLLGGLGKDPAHIAFNELINEKKFLADTHESERNSFALKLRTRLVELSPGTIEANKRFFAPDEEVPHYAITIGFKEIFYADRILIMANSKDKAQSLYHVFNSAVSYRIPASLLRLYLGRIEFFIEKEAFGDEKEELSLRHSKSSAFRIEKMGIDLFSLATTKKIGLINDHVQHKNSVNLPRAKKILVIAKNKKSISLLPTLRERGNHIEFISLDDLADKWPLADCVIFPEDAQRDLLISSLPSRVIRIMYEAEKDHGFDIFFPISKQKMVNKVQSLSKFYLSQNGRSPFREIAKQMTTKKGMFYVERYKDPKNIISSLHSSIKKHTDQVLIVAPHPDDAEIGAGGMLQVLGNYHVPTHVVMATSGAKAHIYKADLARGDFYSKELQTELDSYSEDLLTSYDLKKRIREEECKASLKFLNPTASAYFLDLPFYKNSEEINEEDLSHVKDFLNTFKQPGKLWVFIPYYEDMHKTHRQTSSVFTEALAQLDTQYKIIYYKTPWTGKWNLYHYNRKLGTKLSALVGREMVSGTGNKALSFDQKELAMRYSIY